MSYSDSRMMTKVPVSMADDLIKIVRLLALTGRKVFINYLFEPLDYAGWKRRATNEQSRKLMDRIDKAALDETASHTVGPLARRMVSASMNENLSAVGDCVIFFLEKMQQYAAVACMPEAIEFVKVLHKKLENFSKAHQSQNLQLFETGLQSLDATDFKKAFQPVDLGKHKIKVTMQRQAMDLFNKIKIASTNDDMERCRKMIGAYLVKYGDQEENNREEVDQLIHAFQKREPAFQKNLEDNIAINLFYQIQTSIAQGDLKKTIIGIRKYAHIFQGNPEVRYFNEIDELEGKLYKIITDRDLWEELKAAQ